MRLRREGLGLSSQSRGGRLCVDYRLVSAQSLQGQCHALALGFGAAKLVLHGLLLRVQSLALGFGATELILDGLVFGPQPTLALCQDRYRDDGKDDKPPVTHATTIAQSTTSSAAAGAFGAYAPSEADIGGG